MALSWKEQARQDLPGLLVGRPGDQRVEGLGSPQEVPVHRLFEGAQVLDQPREALHRVGAVILHQVLELLGGIGVGDEGSFAGRAEDAVVGLGNEHLEAVLLQLEQLHHLLAEHEQRPGAHAVLVALEELLGGRHAAGEVRLLQTHDPQPVLGEHTRRGEAVVARSNHDRVVVSHLATPR